MKEEEYKLTLAHVIKWLSGDGVDSWKPVKASYANSIVNICRGVLYEDMTLEDSVRKYKGDF